MNCMHTTRRTVLHGSLQTSMSVAPEAILATICHPSWLGRCSTFRRTMALMGMNCGASTPPTARYGRSPTFLVACQAATLDFTSNFSLAIPCISRRTMEAQESNCGHTTPPIIPHGRRLIFTAPVPVLQDCTCTSSLVIRCISLQRTGAREVSCGPTTHPTIPHGKWQTSPAVRRLVHQGNT